MVLGAKGQLGRELMRQFGASSGCELLAYDADTLDITNRDALYNEVCRQHPAVAINCAAWTDVEGCERDPARAMTVNAQPLVTLAEACDEVDCRLVQISTDFVFDGALSRPYREDDAPAPLGAYAQSKLLSEQYARQARRHLIVRTAWLYGEGAGNFVARVLARSAAGEPLRIVADQIGSPTYCPDLARAMRRLLETDASGVYHVVNAGAASWHALAVRAVELAGHRVEVEPIATADYPSPTRRPANSVLDCSKLFSDTGHRLRDWSESVAEYVSSAAWRR